MFQKGHPNLYFPGSEGKPRIPMPPDVLPGCYVWEIFKGKDQQMWARILGWEKPVRLSARTVLPPLKFKPVYGPKAKAYMHQIPHTVRKPWEHAIARGKRPLTLAHYLQRERYLIRRRARLARAAQPPPFGRIELAGGLRIVR